MNNNKVGLACLSLGLFLSIGCSKFLPPAPGEEELLDGPVAGLTGEQHQRFLAGDIAFNDNIYTPETGLGPIFVATSCGSCHAGDGKGHPFSTITRFGQTDSTGNRFLDQGGPQLQNFAIPGYQPETLPAGAKATHLIPPATTGLGFLATLTDEQILQNADPLDMDGDGISGRPNYMDVPTFFEPQAWAKPQNGKYIGRFGKKASAVTLEQQIVRALHEDLGINSIYAPVDTYSGKEVDPEISTEKINTLAFYLKTLKAPVRRNAESKEVQEGETLFKAVGCKKCHVPDWKTEFSGIEALRNQEFHPYTDLLVHDMGSGLDDGYTEGTAASSEWRTPALWGLGLSKASQGGRYYLLHDGRAASIEEAILYHGGEAQFVRNAFEKLSRAQKDKLVVFLESL